MILQRLFLSVALLLAFTLGMSGFMFDEGVSPKAKTDMAASRMIMTDASMPTLGKCAPCGKSHPRMSACSVICSGTMLPLPIAVQLLLSVSGARYHQWLDRQVAGSAIAPDPYPPKSILG